MTKTTLYDVAAC